MISNIKYSGKIYFALYDDEENFNSNDVDSFVKKFDVFLRNSKDKKIILKNLKISKNFTIFNHYKKFSKYLSQ